MATTLKSSTVDSAFGIEKIEVIDDSVAKVSETTVLGIMPSIHPVFSSDGEDNVLYETGSMDDVYANYGKDFTDMSRYGQQNLNVEQVIKNNGSAYICRLMPDNSRHAHVILKLGIKQEEAIPLWERDPYGSFKKGPDGNRIPIMVTKLGPDGNPEMSDGEEVKVQATSSGIKFKLVADVVNDQDIEDKLSMKSLIKKYKLVADDPSTGYKFYPLQFTHYYARGRCGENYGYMFVNNLARDERVNDGRRYSLTMVKKTNTGVVPLDGIDGINFSFNPEATISPFVPKLEGLHSVYQNLNEKNRKRKIQNFYYTENFEKIQEKIKEILSAELIVPNNYDKTKILTEKMLIDVDFVFGRNKDGNKYDNIIIDEDGLNMSKPLFLKNGYDGDFETKTGNELKQVKDNLLLRFYDCDIDTPNIMDVLRCDAGITYDANYEMPIKMGMTKILNHRRDMGIVFDCGETDSVLEACATADTIAQVMSFGQENCAVIPHFGTTTNRVLNVRVSGTYEVAGGLTNLYRRSPFGVYAGKPNDNGCVRSMVFDWVVEESKPRGYLEKMAKKSNLYYAIDLGKAVNNVIVGNTTNRNVYFYSYANLYPERLSKLAEWRNGLLIGDLRRMIALVFVKYTFDTDGAETSMNAAREELVRICSLRYPSNIGININVFQTEDNAILGTASCRIIVNFPNIFDKWDCTLIVGRGKVTEAA